MVVEAQLAWRSSAGGIGRGRGSRMAACPLTACRLTAAIVLGIAALGIVGCGNSGNQKGAKPQSNKTATANANRSTSPQPSAPPIDEGGDVGGPKLAHPTDALQWDADDKRDDRPTRSGRPAEEAEGKRTAADDGVDAGDQDAAPNDAASPQPDAPAASVAAAGSDDSQSSGSDSSKSKPSAVDLASRERELVAAKNALSKESAERDREQCMSDALALVDAAIDADDYPLAGRVVALALEIAPSLADVELAGEAVKSKRKATQFEAAFRRATAARQTLADDPAAGAANTAVGAYLCYLQGKWDEGLAFLSKGEDAAANKAATLDLAAPTEPDAQRAVADAWWTVAGRQDGVAKAQVMLRARHWYDQMRRSLDIAEQEKLRGRIEMIDKFAVLTGVNVELGLDAELPEATGKLSPAQRGRVQQLLAEFRRASGNPARLESTANKLLSIGGPAVSQLLVEVNKQLQPQLRTYGEEFTRQAASVQASRGGANMAEVERLRAQVLALKEMPNLTKDMIVQQGDPAMAKLTEMLVVEPRMVLERSARLREERVKLLALGRQWERASQYIIAAMQEQEALARAKDRRAAAGENAEAVEPPPLPSFEKYLAGEEELAAKMTMPMDDAARATLAENGKLIGQIETEEARAILACNLMRQLLGLEVLKIDLKLCEAARDHSKDMATLGFFAHESPVPGKTTPWDRAKNFGTTASAENIAMGYADGNAANLGWFHSPGHHKNMLGNHKRIGLGVHNTHYTELFGR